MQHLNTDISPGKPRVLLREHEVTIILGSGRLDNRSALGETEIIIQIFDRTDHRILVRSEAVDIGLASDTDPATHKKFPRLNACLRAALAMSASGRLSFERLG
jgi:hypothetical protein